MQDASSLTFRASARDPDGSIKQYEWFMNGQLVGGSDRMTYFKHPHLKDVSTVEVTLRVHDDSFESAEVTKMVPVN